MPTLIQAILTAIKGASLTAKIIGVTTAVVVVGGTTAVIVVSNSSVQESQDTEENDNSDQDTEQEKNEDKEENKDQDEDLDNSDNQENKTDEQPKTDNQTTNSGTAKPSSSSNSNQSGNSSQQGTSKPAVQPQPATPKAEFNLNDSIQITQFGYTCIKFLGGDRTDPSNYVTAPGGGWIEISATGRRFSKGSGSCPDGYDLDGGAVPRVLDEYWCNLYGLSCDRW